MFDIHCHMLPAVDDGADSTETACAMARAAAADGVRAVILTPHCSVPGAQFHLLPEQILDRTAQLQAELFARDRDYLCVLTRAQFCAILKMEREHDEAGRTDDSRHGAERAVSESGKRL